MDARPKILIVDDKPENLRALEVVLKDLDVDLVKATSGNEALKATLHHDFALALLDIQMPEMDGYELAGILREEEKTAHLPFIFISAVYTDNFNVFKGYEKGAFSFITKPFQPEILQNKVRFFIEKHQQEISLHHLNQDLASKNEDLERAISELEAFTYSVSHDLRAPLRALNGYAEILVEDYGDSIDDAGKSVIKVIRDNAINMAKLIDSLLELSRLGKKELIKGQVNVRALVLGVIETLKESQGGHTEFIVKDLPDLMADKELMKLVFMNLISNAMKYSGKQPQPVVEIGCLQERGKAVYYVKDNGAGFDMKYANKLFGVFQRLHSAQEYEGTGIGLANVNRIISRHGGKVWAEGKIGEGATFYFSLPG